MDAFRARRRRRVRGSFVGLVLGLAFVSVPAGADTACPSDVRGTNPTFADTATIFERVAVAHNMPPQLLKAIAYGEGYDYGTGRRWSQYNADGSIVLSSDGLCGVGIMQITRHWEFDQRRLATDMEYNIDAGAQILDNAWNRSSGSNPPAIGPDDRSLIENWYFPAYFYNGVNGSPAYPDLVAARIADPVGRMTQVAAWAPALGFTRPQDAIPGYRFSASYTARKPGQFLTFDSSGNVTGTYAAAVHEWGSPPPCYPAEVFGPDCGPNFRLTGPLSSWYSGAPYGVVGRMRFTYSNGGSESNGADWTPPLVCGIYDVDAFIPREHANARAHYIVSDAAGTSEHVIDQSPYYDAWVGLGRYAASVQVSISVHLTDRGDPPGSKIIGADGMRFHQVQACRPPDAPTNVSATSGNRQAQVSWSQGGDGGSPITGFTVTASPGGASTTVGGAARSTTVTGLANGTSYTFVVTATNVVGTSAPSEASNAVIPAGPPDPPTNAQATAGNHQAIVSWTASFDEGSPITGYTAKCTAKNDATDHEEASVAGDQTTATVGGLKNAITYTCAVVATNALGNSDPSAPSNEVTPATIGTAPGSVDS